MYVFKINMIIFTATHNPVITPCKCYYTITY